MIVFIQFVCILLTTEVTSTSEINDDFFDECCDLGREWAVRSEGLCGPYPGAATESLGLGAQGTVLCSALVDSCCVQARRDSQCSAGKEMAATQRTCTPLHLYQANEDAKIPRATQPLQRWTDAIHPLPPGPTTPATAFSIASTGLDICERFKDELCAHRCIANADDSYHCECHEGFILQADDKSCSPNDSSVEELGSDRDKAEMNLGLEGGINQPGGGGGAGNRDSSSSQILLQQETCERGYAWNRITHQCEDIDECVLDLHNCHFNQMCVNIEGNFQCEEERDDTNIYDDDDDDDYPETNPPPINTTAAATATTSRLTLRSRSKEERLTFTARPPPTTRSPRVPPGQRTTQRAKEKEEKEEEAIQCLFGFAPDDRKSNCVDVDECSSGAHNCRRPNELCINTVGSHRCQCEHGYTANSETGFCEDVNECRLTPTICGSEQECQNTPGSYRCTRKTPTCSLGYRLNLSGTQCIDEDECSANGNICGGEKNCENTIGSYLCRCFVGYQLNDSTSQCDDVDECRSREFTCHGGQSCVNTPGSFECRCETGFTLDPRTNGCVDIDECRQNQRPCDENEICENIRGSFRCLQKTLSCPTGFAPDHSGRRCTDVDECQMGTHNCQIAWACYNTLGSFHCVLKQCPRGQRLDHETGQCTPVVCARGMRLDHANTCADINECVERPNICRSHQVCRNTIGSYLCQDSVTCGSGYEINKDTGHCDDVDECQRGSHRCHGNGIQCVNQPGTYLCQCPQGYQLIQQRQSCEDIDECRLYREHICSQNALCENLPGSYRCTCKEGFEMAEDKRSCRDVNECLRLPRLCQHSCHNTWGSFECSCNNGFQLSSTDSKSCSDIDECAVWSLRGTLLCQGICENTPGSYRCTCPPGYQMGTDGRICRDVDECFGGGSCSHPDDVCINTRGGHRCQNVVCPKGFTRLLNSNKNSHAIRCQRKTFTCAQGDADCLYAPLSYSVNFVAIPGKLIRVPTALFTMRGPVTSHRRLQFQLKVVAAFDPRTGAIGANRTHFGLYQNQPNEVVVQLVEEIQGPNDIQLQLTMDVFSRDSSSQSQSQSQFQSRSDEETFFGTALAKIFIYITEDPW